MRGCIDEGGWTQRLLVVPQGERIVPLQDSARRRLEGVTGG